MTTAPAVMIPAITGGCRHQGCPCGVGSGDGSVAGLCPARGCGVGCCVIVTSLALPMAGLPVPEVCCVMVVRGRSAVIRTASIPTAATITVGLVHHLTIGTSLLL